MKVLIYESPNSINLWFNQPDYQIPFLATNLLSFNSMGFLRLAADTGDNVSFFVPQHWEVGNSEFFKPYDGSSIYETLEAHQTHEYELVFLLSAFSLLVGDFDTSDISHFKQNPEKFFINRGVVGGFLKKGQELPQPEEFNGFNYFLELNESNYLRLNQDLVGNLTIKSVNTDARTYGSPIIMSSSISPDSTICAPCYVGKDVVVNGSYIGPGTILRGNSRVTGSRVSGSLLENTSVDTCQLNNVVSSNSVVGNINLENSVLPFGSVINNAG